MLVRFGAKAKIRLGEVAMSRLVIVLVSVTAGFGCKGREEPAETAEPATPVEAAAKTLDDSMEAPPPVEVPPEPEQLPAEPEPALPSRAVPAPEPIPSIPIQAPTPEPPPTTPSRAEPPEVKEYDVAPPPPPQKDVVQALPKKEPIAPSGVPIEGPDADPIEGPDSVPIEGPKGVPIKGPEPVPIGSE